MREKHQHDHKSSTTKRWRTKLWGIHVRFSWRESTGNTSTHTEMETASLLKSCCAEFWYCCQYDGFPLPLDTYNLLFHDSCCNLPCNSHLFVERGERTFGSPSKCNYKECQEEKVLEKVFRNFQDNRTGKPFVTTNWLCGGWAALKFIIDQTVCAEEKEFTTRWPWHVPLIKAIMQSLANQQWVATRIMQWGLSA